MSSWDESEDFQWGEELPDFHVPYLPEGVVVQKDIDLCTKSGENVKNVLNTDNTKKNPQLPKKNISESLLRTYAGKFLKEPRKTPIIKSLSTTTLNEATEASERITDDRKATYREKDYRSQDS